MEFSKDRESISFSWVCVYGLATRASVKEIAVLNILIDHSRLGHCQLQVPFCCIKLARKELHVVGFLAHVGMSWKDPASS